MTSETVEDVTPVARVNLNSGAVVDVEVIKHDKSDLSVMQLVVIIPVTGPALVSVYKTFISVTSVVEVAGDKVTGLVNAVLNEVF